MPFRQELVDIALETQQGLMTSWDFYRLVINAQKHSWKPGDVKSVLYRHGRIDPVPNHYTQLGRVSQVWRGAFGIDIEHGSVSVGDTVALEFEVFFEEVIVTSIKVEGADKEQAFIGEKTGIPLPAAFGRPRVGMRVFVAKNSLPSQANGGADATSSAGVA